jgi:AraC-like DNA-binding protein
MDLTAEIAAALRAGEPIAEFTRSLDHVMAPHVNRGTAALSFRVMLEGSCRVVPLAGAVRPFEPIVLHPGDMALFGPGVTHGISAVDIMDSRAPRQPTAAAAESLFCGYRLGARRPHPVLQSLPSVSHISVRTACSNDFQSLLSLVRRELDEEDGPRFGPTPALIDAALTYLLRTWLRHTAHDRFPSRSDPVVGRVLRAMHARIDHPWTVAELAAVAGLSRAAFARRFTKSIGQPALGYLTAVRLAEATELLRKTDKSITQIARATGYGSQITLTRAFHREYGTTPGAYRVRSAGRSQGPAGEALEVAG